MNNRMKILLIAGAVMVLLLVAGYLKQQDRNSDGSQNSVMSIETAIEDKTYMSKKAAYEAYANEKESFYNRPPSGFEPAAELSEPSVPKAENAQSASSTTFRVDRKASEEQFDAAYEEIAQNMDQIYEDGTPATKSRQAAASVPDEPVTDEATPSSSGHDARLGSRTVLTTGTGESSGGLYVPGCDSRHAVREVRADSTVPDQRTDSLRQLGGSGQYAAVRSCVDLGKQTLREDQLRAHGPRGVLPAIGRLWVGRDAGNTAQLRRSREDRQLADLHDGGSGGQFGCVPVRGNGRPGRRVDDLRSRQPGAQRQDRRDKTDRQSDRNS